MRQPQGTTQITCQRCKKPFTIAANRPGARPKYCRRCAKQAASDQVRQWRKLHPDAAKAAAKRQNDKRRAPAVAQCSGFDNIPPTLPPSQRYKLDESIVSPHHQRILRWAEAGNEDLTVEDNLGDARIAVMVESLRLAPEAASDKTALMFADRDRDELTKRLNDPGITVQTIYEVGQHALQHYWGNPPLGQRRRKYAALSDDWLMNAVSQRLHDKDLNPQGGYAMWKKALVRLCDLVRLTLTNPSDHQGLVALVQHYSVSPDLPDWALDGVASILLQGQILAREERLCDRLDRIWLPITWNLPIEQFTFIVIDGEPHKLEQQFIERMRALAGRIVWFANAEVQRIV